MSIVTIVKKAIKNLPAQHRCSIPKLSRIWDKLMTDQIVLNPLQILAKFLHHEKVTARNEIRDQILVQLSQDPNERNLFVLHLSQILKKFPTSKVLELVPFLGLCRIESSIEGSVESQGQNSENLFELATPMDPDQIL